MKETIQLLKSYMKNKEDKIYIVGEYVRDKLKDSSKEPKTLDIVVDGNEACLIKYLEAHEFKFDKLKDKQRGHKKTKESAELYIWTNKGQNIEEYLQGVDFTVNAIALDIKDNKMIDPYNGRRDIKSKLVNEVMQESISKAPIRIITAIKLSLENGMHLGGFTEEHIRLYKDKIDESDKDELYEALLSLFSKDLYGNAIEFLDRYEILENIFPYIKEAKTIGKCKYHVVNAYTHMEMTYRNFKDLISGRLSLNGIKDVLIDKLVQNFSLYDYIAISAFLHDIGKFAAYKKENGQVSFTNHNELGARITEEVLEKLGFPKEAIEIITTIIEGHMHPLRIFKAGGMSQKKAIEDFFNKYKEIAPMIIAVSFCDVYATLSLKDDDNQEDAFKIFMENLIQEYRTFI